MDEAESGQRPQDTEPGLRAVKGTSLHAVGVAWWLGVRAHPDPDDRAVTLRETRV